MWSILGAITYAVNTSAAVDETNQQQCQTPRAIEATGAGRRTLTGGAMTPLPRRRSGSVAKLTARDPRRPANP